MIAQAWWNVAALGGWCIYVAAILGVIGWIVWEVYQGDKQD